MSVFVFMLSFVLSVGFMVDLAVYWVDLLLCIGDLKVNIHVHFACQRNDLRQMHSQIGSLVQIITSQDLQAR